MIRVCCVFGPWQLVTLLAALEKNANGASASDCEDYLLLYETAGVPDTFKHAVRTMAQTAWPWKKIIEVYEVLTNEKNVNQRQYEGLLSTLRQHLGADAERVGEIWTCLATRPAERLVFEAFPQARISVYEDGLISYLPVTVAARWQPGYKPRNTVEALLMPLRAFEENIAPVKRFRRHLWKVDPRHLARVHNVYFQLSPAVRTPEIWRDVPCHFVEYTFLRRALARVEPALPPEAWTDIEPEGAPDRVLILGQALARNNIMSRDEERGFYTTVLETVLERDWRVLWKEHPRISQPYFDELHAWANARSAEWGARLRRLSLPHAYPVELVANRLDLAGCVSGTSAAPFYLRGLYDLPCYTFAGTLREKMKDVDVLMSDIVQQAIPSLEELPRRSDSFVTKERDHMQKEL